MLTRRAFMAGAAALAPTFSARWAWAQDPDLPREPATKPGRYKLNLERDRDGLFYLPAGYKPETPMPLMVVLHGAGGSAESAVGAFPLADELGFIVLATDAKDWTWDSIIGAFGPDVEFLQRAFVSVMQRCSVDKARLALTGFSDGASYALSLGIGNGDVFTSIIAGSPGVMQPATVAGKPRIFISHGTADNVMPIDDTSRKFVPRLRALGYDVTYREYEGRHTWPPEIRREAYVWWVEGSKNK
jgi:phospholipase/carboxylesterase